MAITKQNKQEKKTIKEHYNVWWNTIASESSIKNILTGHKYLLIDCIKTYKPHFYFLAKYVHDLDKIVNNV